MEILRGHMIINCMSFKAWHPIRKWSFGLICLFQVGDIVSTYYTMKAHNVIEANPLLQGAMGQADMLRVVLFKLVGMVVLFLFFGWADKIAKRKHTEYKLGRMIIMVGFCAAVVIWNITLFIVRR